MHSFRKTNKFQLSATFYTQKDTHTHKCKHKTQTHSHPQTIENYTKLEGEKKEDIELLKENYIRVGTLMVLCNYEATQNHRTIIPVLYK